MATRVFSDDELECLRGFQEIDQSALDEPLFINEELVSTRLHWLDKGPTQASPPAVEAELDKLAFLRDLDAHRLDLSMLPAERRRFLAGLGRWLTAQALARRDRERRYPILLTLLAQSPVEVLDEVIDLVLDTGGENRSQLVFTTARGRAPCSRRPPGSANRRAPGATAARLEQGDPRGSRRRQRDLRAAPAARKGTEQCP